MTARLAAAALTLVAACSRPGAPAPPPCPTEDVIEALHAAAFHLEHGELARGRAALDLISAAEDARLTRMHAALAAAANATDADSRRRATESVRADLSGWACLPEPLHARFHAKLPALR